MKKEIEIDVFENNEHIFEKDGILYVIMPKFPKNKIGKVCSEFIETEDGKFEEIIIKEVEDE